MVEPTAVSGAAAGARNQEARSAIARPVRPPTTPASRARPIGPAALHDVNLASHGEITAWLEREASDPWKPRPVSPTAGAGSTIRTRSSPSCRPRSAGSSTPSGSTAAPADPAADRVDGRHAYRYSGLINEPQPWPVALAALRDRLSAELGVGFNSCLANLYRDGTRLDGLPRRRRAGARSAPVIASLSLGARRRFAIRHRTTKRALDLGAGRGRPAGHVRGIAARLPARGPEDRPARRSEDEPHLPALRTRLAVPISRSARQTG